MQDLRNYIFSILCAALLCGILGKLIQDTLIQNLIHILCGLVLTLTVLRPLGDLDLDLMDLFTDAYLMNAQDAVRSGKEIGQDALAALIKEKVEAYISDKGAEWHTDLTAQVFLNDEHIPVSVEIYGNVSPYVKSKLVSMIENDLGITEENQLWTG